MASPSSGCVVLAFFHQRGKVLGGAFGGAVDGWALYMKEETFGKGILWLCPVFVIARRDAVVISTWRVPWGEKVLFRGKRLSGQGFSPEGFL